jgi:hypothetical protein
MGCDRRDSRHRVPDLATLLLIAACHHASSSELPDAATDDAPIDAAVGYQSTTLQTLPYSSGGRNWTIQLVRIDRPDGGHTYVEGIPSYTAGARPAMVMTEPYTGIDWTGDPLDTRWATYMPQSDGLYLDVDGPSFDGTQTISYTLESPTQSASDVTLHLLDGFGVVMIYGRYYAGGTVREYVADMAAGMWFVAEQPQIDPARVGIYGASWGGFEALWAAQQARVQPTAIAAAFPVSDFPTEIEHTLAVTDPAATFFESYQHRVYAATGGPPTQPGVDYSGLVVGDLCAHLPSATLALHDEGDNLVPIAETQTLVSTCGVTPLYWDRTAPPDPGSASHGLLTTEPAPASYTTFAFTYVALRILAPDQTGVVEAYSPEAMVAQLTTAYTAEAAGRDISFEAPRLLEMCDARVAFVSADNCTATSCPVVDGATVIAGLVNQVWGTSYTASTIAAALANGMPPLQ